MWKLYLESGGGVAIQSTFRRLAESFNSYEENDVYIGKVQYIDYEKDTFPETSLFYPVLHKRKSFQHERELRAFIFNIPSKENGEIDLSLEVFDKGAYIPVDLDVLIEEIFVSPTAEDWLKDLVESIVGKSDISKQVEHSSLSKDAVYIRETSNARALDVSDR